MSLTINLPLEYDVGNSRLWWITTNMGRSEKSFGIEPSVYPHAQIPLTFEIISTEDPGTEVYITHNNHVVFGPGDGLVLDINQQCQFDLQLTRYGLKDTSTNEYIIPNNIIEVQCGLDKETAFVYITYTMVLITTMAQAWENLYNSIMRTLDAMSLYGSDYRILHRNSLYFNWGILMHESALYGVVDNDTYIDFVQKAYEGSRANCIQDSFTNLAYALTNEIPKIYAWETAFCNLYDKEGVMSVKNKPSLDFEWNELWWRFREDLYYLPIGDDSVNPNSTTYVYLDGSRTTDGSDPNFGHYYVTKASSYPTTTIFKDYYPLGCIISDDTKITSIIDYSLSTPDSTMLISGVGQRYTMVLQFNNDYSDEIIGAMQSVFHKIKNASSWILLSFPGNEKYYEA